jgi:hypothetical protein
MCGCACARQRAWPTACAPSDARRLGRNRRLRCARRGKKTADLRINAASASGSEMTRTARLLGPSRYEQRCAGSSAKGVIIGA